MEMMLSKAFRPSTQQASDQNPCDFFDATPLIAALNHADFFSVFLWYVKQFAPFNRSFISTEMALPGNTSVQVIFNVTDLQEFICNKKTITVAIIH